MGGDMGAGAADIAANAQDASAAPTKTAAPFATGVSQFMAEKSEAVV
jgi:hypothetical protein